MPRHQTPPKTLRPVSGGSQWNAGCWCAEVPLRLCCPSPGLHTQPGLPPQGCCAMRLHHNSCSKPVSIHRRCPVYAPAVDGMPSAGPMTVASIMLPRAPATMPGLLQPYGTSRGRSRPSARSCPRCLSACLSAVGRSLTDSPADCRRTRAAHFNLCSGVARRLIPSCIAMFQVSCSCPL